MVGIAELVEKREQLKREIAAGRDKTLMAWTFHRTDRLIRMVTRRRQPVSWMYSASVLALTILLLELLLAALFDVAPIWSLISIAFLVQAIFAVLLAHIFFDSRLPDLLDHLADAIQSANDLADLRQWLTGVWSARSCLVFVALFSVAWCLFSNTIGNILNSSEFAKLGLVPGILGNLVYASILGIPLYYVLWLLRLPARISRYHYGLYEFDPVNSEIISHLSWTFNFAAFEISLLTAVGTLMLAFMNAPVLLVGVILAGWVPLIILFISSQNAIRKIVTTAKWKTLNELQTRIDLLRMEVNLAEKETMDAIVRLMDLHDRIQATRNSALDLRAGLLFLNQLVLPILIFIINYVLTSIANRS